MPRSKRSSLSQANIVRSKRRATCPKDRREEKLVARQHSCQSEDTVIDAVVEGSQLGRTLNAYHGLAHPSTFPRQIAHNFYPTRRQ